jgi:hypothetical protein
MNSLAEVIASRRGSGTPAWARLPAPADPADFGALLPASSGEVACVIGEREPLRDALAVLAAASEALGQRTHLVHIDDPQVSFSRVSVRGFARGLGLREPHTITHTYPELVPDVDTIIYEGCIHDERIVVVGSIDRVNHSNEYLDNQLLGITDAARFGDRGVILGLAVPFDGFDEYTIDEIEMLVGEAGLRRIVTRHAGEHTLTLCPAGGDPVTVALPGVRWGWHPLDG